MSSPQDSGRTARLQRFAPAGRAQAPAVAGPEVRKAELGHRRRKIIAGGFGKLQKPGSHDVADRVAPEIFWIGVREIFARGSNRVLLDLLRLLFAACNRALLVRVRSDKARVDRKSVRADQTLRQAPLNDGLEKAACRSGESARVCSSRTSSDRDFAVHSESAEPAIGEIEMNLVAKATFGPMPMQ